MQTCPLCSLFSQSEEVFQIADALERFQHARAIMEQEREEGLGPWVDDSSGELAE